MINVKHIVWSCVRMLMGTQSPDYEQKPLSSSMEIRNQCNFHTSEDDVRTADLLHWAPSLYYLTNGQR